MPATSSPVAVALEQFKKCHPHADKEVMKTFSMDLRERVIKAYEENECSMRVVAEQFGVSRDWIKKLVRRKRETGSIAPKDTKRGRKRAIDGADLKRLEEAVENQPDATLDQLRTAVGVKCSIVTVHNALARQGYRRLKKRYAPASRTVRM
jgi:transposase